MIYTAEFWVLVAFVMFFGVLAYFGVHHLIVGAVDARAERVETELAEARRLREEAEALLAEYESKRKQAEGEATALVAAAEEEAKRLATEAEAKLAEFVQRRTAQAEQKIAQAEAQATAEVRAAAADAATRAAEAILKVEVTGAGGEALVRAGLKQVTTRLN